MHFLQWFVYSQFCGHGKISNVTERRAVRPAKHDRGYPSN